MKCNQSRPGFELVSPCPFPSTITITPRAPPNQKLMDTDWAALRIRWLNTLQRGEKSKKGCLHYNSHHHDDVRLARISLTLSLYVSLSFIAFGRSSGLHPVSSHSCCMNVRAGRPAFAWPYAGVHRSTSLTISSLLRIKWWGSSFVGLDRTEYFFIVIASKFTLTRSGSTC